MNAEMILAIAGLITAIGSIIGIILSNRKIMALLEYRMSEVEKRLDTHNHYAERFTETTIAITKIQKDVEYLREKLNEKMD